MPPGFTPVNDIDSRLRALEDSHGTRLKTLEETTQRQDIELASLREDRKRLQRIIDGLQIRIEELEGAANPNKEAQDPPVTRIERLAGPSTNIIAVSTNTTEQRQEARDLRVGGLQGTGADVLPVSSGPVNQGRRSPRTQAEGLEIPDDDVQPLLTNPTNEAGGPSHPLSDGSALRPAPDGPGEDLNLGRRYLALLRSLEAGGAGLENRLGNLQRFLRSLGTTAIELALFTRTDGITRHSYFLKVVGPNGFQNIMIPSLRSVWNVDDATQSEADEERVKKTGILEWMDTRSERTEEPEYVLCLGEMYVRTDNFTSANPVSWKMDEITSRSKKETGRREYWKILNITKKLNPFRIEDTGTELITAVKLVDDIAQWQPGTPGETNGLMLDSTSLLVKIMGAPEPNCQPAFTVPRWEEMCEVVGGGALKE